jgi:hypothetical protein
MLPDFPKSKMQLDQLLMTYFDQEVRRHSVDLPRFVQHEGDHSTLHREDGTVEQDAPDEARVNVVMPKDQFPNVSLADVKRLYVEAASSMAPQIMGSFFRVVNEAVTVSGNVVDAGGRELSFDLLLEAFGKVSMEFDERGNPILPALMMHPKTWAAVKDKVAAWDLDPTYRARFRQLIERKREDWRERESHRKLVD